MTISIGSGEAGFVWITNMRKKLGSPGLKLFD